MRWALIRARDTGVKHRVVGYCRPSWRGDAPGWSYMVRRDLHDAELAAIRRAE